MSAIHFKLNGDTLHTIFQNTDCLNEALFCGDCGEVWGRVEIEGRRYWFVRNRPCERHGGGNFYDYLYCDVAGRELAGAFLRREFLMQTAFLEEMKNERRSTAGNTEAA